MKGYRRLDFLKLGVKHCPKISTLVSSNRGMISILKCIGQHFKILTLSGFEGTRFDILGQ